MTGELDLEGASACALDVLRQQLAPYLTYHSVYHTESEVVPAATRLAHLSGVTGEDLLLLQTAAWYHDLGYVERSVGHEAISIRIASSVLPRYGYRDAHIAQITAMIQATVTPQMPHSLLQELLVDADLDNLGAPTFFERSHALRLERAAEGHHVSDAEWYRSQIEFLQAHHYFTPAAHTLRDAGKTEHLATLAEMVEATGDMGTR